MYCITFISVIHLIWLSDAYALTVNDSSSESNVNPKQVTTEDLLFGGTNDTCLTQIEYTNKENETITLGNESIV